MLPSKPECMREKSEVAVDETENGREKHPTKFCQAREPTGAKSIVAVQPASDAKDRVKTGRGSGLGTREGHVE